MNDSLETIDRLINECSDDERRAVKSLLKKLSPHPLESEWGIEADTILSAINRSSDLTKRGIRGIIAEAVFVDEVIPAVADSGWKSVAMSGDYPYDALLKKGDKPARIQVKLQRLEKGAPKLYYPKHYKEGSLYVVEVQKTRSGKKTVKKTLPGTDTQLAVTTSVTEETRPYNFGEFDILAVNLHPSSGDWKNFRYTLGSWLLPRRSNPSRIEIFQPVAATPGDLWTDDFAICLNWFESGEKHQVLAELLHLPKKKKK
jgi:hypothetical protein